MHSPLIAPGMYVEGSSLDASWTFFFHHRRPVTCCGNTSIVGTSCQARWTCSNVTILYHLFQRWGGGGGGGGGSESIGLHLFQRDWGGGGVLRVLVFLLHHLFQRLGGGGGGGVLALWRTAYFLVHCIVSFAERLSLSRESPLSE